MAKSEFVVTLRCGRCGAIFKPRSFSEAFRFAWHHLRKRRRCE